MEKLEGNGRFIDSSFHARNRFLVNLVFKDRKKTVCHTILHYLNLICY